MGWTRQGNRKRRLQRTIGLILVALWAPGPAWSVEILPLPPMAPVERGEYVAKDADTGVELWRTQWAVDEVSHDGQTTVRVEEDGKGIRGTKTPTEWTVRMLLDISSKETRFSSRRDIRDESGRLLRVQERELDYTAGSGRIVTRDARTGKTDSQTISLPSRTIGVEILASELRVVPDQPGQQMRFVLVTLGGKEVEMLAKIVGREQVQVPAGSFECYKVELTPTGFVGMVAGIIMPKMYMWHTVAAPHIWVKYQGPEGGVGSRRIVRDLVRFTPLPPGPPAASLHGSSS